MNTISCDITLDNDVWVVVCGDVTLVAKSSDELAEKLTTLCTAPVAQDTVEPLLAFMSKIAKALPASR